MKSMNVTQKILKEHLQSGDMKAGEEISIKIDQTLTQDATGTLVMLEFEAMNVPKVKTEISAQYVDHNLIQADFKNPDDHLFLLSACKKFGIHFSRPGNGVSHPVHMENFGKPGKSLLGSDSHTCAAGSMGMIAIGAGGLDVALAMSGEPFMLNMPKIFGIKLTGELPDWVSAKDIILEMLRKFDVNGGVGKIIEYYGPGLKNLSAMDRHVIANMGAELGATTTVFPADERVKEFLIQQNREKDFKKIIADESAEYDEHHEINLSELEPLIACPSSPGNVVPVSEVEGKDIYQSMIGSSANPGFRDFAVAAEIVKDRKVNERVSFDINPTSRQIFENLMESGHLKKLTRAGGRIHQAGCNGCIGMGQAPATNKISLRTVPRNFPGRSGNKEDMVYLCSPETAVVSAIKGKITDPRVMDMEYPKIVEPKKIILNRDMILKPTTHGESFQLEKGPNIKPMPELEPIKDNYDLTIVLKVGDNISTDEILPAGSKILPFRSNIPEISKFVFSQVDDEFYKRAIKFKEKGFIIVGGENYGQGSSREHAAIAPRYLGLKIVIAKSYSRIHWSNLINFGILPLQFNSKKDWKHIDQGDILEIKGLRDQVENLGRVKIYNKTKTMEIVTKHTLSEHQIDSILLGGEINLIKNKVVS